MPLAKTTKPPGRGSRYNPAEAWQCAWWAEPSYARKDGTLSARVQSWRGALRKPDRSVVYFDATTKRQALSSARGYGYRHYSQSEGAKAIRAEAAQAPAGG